MINVKSRKTAWLIVNKALEVINFIFVTSLFMKQLQQVS